MKVVIYIFVVFAITGVGCTARFKRSIGSFDGSYDVVFENIGNDVLHDVTFVNAPAPVPCGILSPGISKSSTCFFEIPETVTISWHDSRGEEHRKGIAVRTQIRNPDNSNGSIGFLMSDADIELVIFYEHNSYYKSRRAMTAKGTD